MPPSDQISLLRPILFALGTTYCTIIIHGFTLALIIRLVRRDFVLGRAGVALWKDVTIVSGATLLALTAHLVEIALWALLFSECGEFLNFAVAFYHSAVNYTTLGYGDVIMSASWRMLGPLEAADGMLMFGVSTGAIFAVVQRLIQERFTDSGDLKPRKTGPARRQK